MKIKRKVLNEIVSTIGKKKPETGGVLGIRNDVICAFYFDINSDYQEGEYCPDTNDINLKLQEWGEDGIDFAGLIHSHPNNCQLLSNGDKVGIETIVKAIPPFDALYFPIVTNEDNGFYMSVYCVRGSKENICISEIGYEVLD